ncbi:GntR family transcriptional regulator [Billgrantia endophytica]|uniref:GntR family transcriptional regulator n=2 Tax=Billgrantia endophytica TaxID=2033802 RepID=A0A2N7TZH9_9GAMM|nr:GntR family transcriptional regulator [Halomonas endophytica]
MNMQVLDTENSKFTSLPAPERAYIIIREAILSGEYLPNDRLREDELASLVGTSRTPVRTALHRLAQDGFVVFHPNSGAAVRGWTRKDAIEIFQVRACLESCAAGFAARNATPRDIRDLEVICDEMESYQLAPETVESLSVLNRKFHTKILKLASNSKLEETALSLMDIGFLIRSYRFFSTKDEQRSLIHHRDLVAAIAAGDSDWSSSIMKAHIMAACDLVRTSEE